MHQVTLYERKFATFSRALTLLLVFNGCAVGPGDEPVGVSVAELDVTGTTDEDVGLIADARGWTFDQSMAQLIATEAVGRVAQRLAEERPEIFVGSMVSSVPGGTPTLFVKGSADDYVQDLIASETVEISIADNQPFSFSELEERQLRVHRAIESAGFIAATAVRIELGGQIETTVAQTQDITASDVEAVLPDDLRNDVLIAFDDESGFQDQAGDIFGGMWAVVGTTNTCTTAWVVIDQFSQKGLTTAGHCTNINGVRNPVTGIRSTFPIAENIGFWGDFEWHRQTGENFQPDDFYADTTNIRDVAGVEAASNISVGEGICFFGRAGGTRNCNATVDAVSVSCLSANSLVRMSAAITIAGDSGGGWSVNNTAYGVHTGLCNSKSVFSKADLIDNALNVDVVF